MKNVINVLVRAVVMAVVFAATAYFVNIFENRNYDDLAMEMKEAELPLAYVRYGDSLLNCMHGYTGDVDISLLRESITPIDDKKNIEICVENTGEFADKYSYEIRSVSGDSLIEKGNPDIIDDKEGYDVLDITVRMDLKPDREYMLVVTAGGRDGRKADYYTRIVVNNDYHESEIMKTVQDFHGASFDFDALESESVIGTYKQEYNGGDTGDSFGLGHTNLGSSYSEILWDGMRPSIVSNVNMYIKEIDVNYAVVELDYKMKSTTDQDVTSGYSVKEIYKVSYTEVSEETDEQPDEWADGADTDISDDSHEVPVMVPKISVVSFDRYVDEYFDRKGIDAVNNVYEIGIVSSDDLEYRYTEDNKKLAFVKNGQLWLYDYAESDIALVYSFWTDDYTDERNAYDNYDINIIELDKDGNMTFAVYGYMNRGEHEGRLGIGLYTLDYSRLELDELLFAECDVPYEAMKNETSRLTYFDGDNFYFMLGDKVNCINVESRQQSYVADNLTARDVKVSANMEVMAFGDSDIQKDNTTITLMNMKTGSNYEITAGSGQCLVCYGFKDSDMVYGVANISDEQTNVDVESFADTRYSAEQNNSIPAYKLGIVNSQGEQIKEYEKNGCYLMQVDVETNLLYLTRAEKSNGKFTAVTDDFITFKEDDNKPTIDIMHNVSYTGYDRLYFTVPQNIYLSYIPNLSITKGKVCRDGVSIILTMKRDRVTYHVYGNLGLEKIYDVAGDAINYAVSVDGIVVSSEGEIVYRNSESQEYNTIAARIFHHSSGTVEKSLTDCIYMVLEYQGVQTTKEDIGQYPDAISALNGLGNKEAIDITGLSLEMVLGYVSDEIPVISRIDDGRYVLVVSYNEEDVRYYDPVENKEIVVSREEYTELMNRCGSELYTYIEN